MSETIRVLCVAATGQSGSTILARMLGELPGFVAVGEVGRIWDKGLEEDIVCSCGEPFSACAFWREVGGRAFGGWHEVDGPGIARLRDSLALRELPLPHPFALPFLLRPGLWAAYRDRLGRYRDLMFPVYRALSELTGGAVLVDSMKIPAHVYLVSLHMPELQVGVVHHVRDARGFAYSNVKLVERQGDVRKRGPYRNRRPPWRSALRWDWFNLAFDLLERRGVPSVTVRYEDLVRDPVPVLRVAAGVVGAEPDPGAFDFVDGPGVRLRAGHIASGSRGRMRAGTIALREDLEWTHALPPRDRAIVTAITRPLLRRYGYRPEDPMAEAVR
jgi:hypothetical protein